MSKQPQPEVNTQTQAQKIHEEYMKTKIQEVFKLYSLDKKGIIEIKEIPYIMRYLGQFPSEVQVRDVILPEIFKDIELTDFITYEQLEPYLLKVLREKEYEPDEPDILMSAFLLMDPDEKGFIEIDMLRIFLEKQGIEFQEQETEEFIKFATNNDQNATVVYYEDYILRLKSYYDRHMEIIYKDYDDFKKQQLAQ